MTQHNFPDRETVRSLVLGAKAAPPDFQCPDPWMVLIKARYPDVQSIGKKPQQQIKKQQIKTWVDETLQEIEADDISGKTELPVGDSSRVRILQACLKEKGLDGYLLNRSDEYLGEYVARADERLWYITGFSGSAGLLLVTRKKAFLFVDGRYRLQAPDQTDSSIVSCQNLAMTEIAETARAHLPKKARLGYDPGQFSIASRRRLAAALNEKETKNGKAAWQGQLVPVAPNLVDGFWTGNKQTNQSGLSHPPNPPRPPAPTGLVRPQPLRYAGESSREKCSRMAALLQEKQARYLVISAPDLICWLLNIRGNDVPNCPLVHARAILSSDGQVSWFVAKEKLALLQPDDLPECVTIRPLERFFKTLKKIAAESSKKSSAKTPFIWLDPRQTPDSVFKTLCDNKARILEASDPCELARALKNTAEQKGMVNAHLRDGRAMIRFLHWLDQEVAARRYPGELDIDSRLIKERGKEKLFRGPSFDTIAGSGPNGAIVHYRATAENHRCLKAGELLLVDSGGQYQDGTTDITRTIAIGRPTSAMRQDYTRVLKGHIALASQIFPEGTGGAQLDCLARSALWKAGLDYAHGTGHGVGAYLNVHEGPQSISHGAGDIALQPGMVLSNEPGLYRTGHYGIRIENLVLVQGKKFAGADDQKAFLSFKTLTLVPFERRLIDKRLLNREEIDWINQYHQRIMKAHQNYLEKSCLHWLEQACALL